MKTNIKKIRLVRNAFEVEVEPRMGDHAVFQGSGGFVKKTESNNEDGTVNVVYDLKPDLLEIKSLSTSDRTDDLEITKDFIKDKSESQSHRAILFRLWEAKNKPGTFKGFYQSRYDSYNEEVSKEIDKEVMGY